MKWQSILAGALASVFGALFIADTASADVRIVNDPGGEVSSYLRTFHEVRATGERIVIDGAWPVGMHVTDGYCAARSCLRHQTCRVGFPRRVLLQRRIALASADAHRHSIGDAVLSPGNSRLDQPAWRAHAAAHHDARPGSGGALPALSLTCLRQLGDVGRDAPRLSRVSSLVANGGPAVACRAHLT